MNDRRLVAALYDGLVALYRGFDLNHHNACYESYELKMHPRPDYYAAANISLAVRLAEVRHIYMMTYESNLPRSRRA